MKENFAYFKNKLKLLGIKIDNLSKEETLEKVKRFLGGKKFCQVATVNPEFILLAQEDKEFKKILNSCDLNVADGFGIKLAFWKSGKNLKSRIAGIDLMLEILKIASQNNYNIFLAANKNGLSDWKETRAAILAIYPNLKINGADLSLCEKNNNEASYPPAGRAGKLPRLPGGRQATSYKILFCNFGAPHQEKFINSIKNDNIKLAMGVGGSFDFITGKIRRAPLWIRNIGLEWLWRLILQPKRFKRAFNSVVIFLWKAMFEKIILLNNKKDIK